MIVVMMLVLAFAVDVCNVRPATAAVLGYAQTMLRTLLFHLVPMHKRKKPCEDVAQHQRNMAEFCQHSSDFVL